MGDRFPLLKFSVFTLVCLAFAAWLISVIGNISPFADRSGYSARMEDVTGLLVNDAVKISGVTVGKVNGIEVEDGGTALVRFTVDEEVRLTDDTHVSVRWRDVFGLRFLYLDPGDGEVVAADHTFPIEQSSAPADLGRLLDRLTPVMSALEPELQNQFLEAMAGALVGREQEIQSLIAEGASLTQAVASRDQEIGRLLTNAATILDAYARREAELRGLLTSFADVSETLADRNDVLAQAVSALADAQEELGSFVDDNDEELRLAFDALEDVADVLAVNHDNLEKIVTTTGRGLVSYHRISRLGQWFNVRAVGASVDYEPVSTEREAQLPPERCQPDSCPDTSGTRQSAAQRSGAEAFFTMPTPEGGR